RRGGHEIYLLLGKLVLHSWRACPVDQLLRGFGIFRALDERDPFGCRADAFLREADRDAVPFRLGVQCIDDEEDPAARLTEAYRQGAAATALRVELHVGTQLLHVVE